MFLRTAASPIDSLHKNSHCAVIQILVATKREERVRERECVCVRERKRERQREERVRERERRAWPHIKFNL